MSSVYIFSVLKMMVYSIDKCRTSRDSRFLEMSDAEVMRVLKETNRNVCGICSDEEFEQEFYPKLNSFLICKNMKSVCIAYVIIEGEDSYQTSSKDLSFIFEQIRHYWSNGFISEDEDLSEDIITNFNEMESSSGIKFKTFLYNCKNRDDIFKVLSIIKNTTSHINSFKRKRNHSELTFVFSDLYTDKEIEIMCPLLDKYKYMTIFSISGEKCESESTCKFLSLFSDTPNSLLYFCFNLNNYLKECPNGPINVKVTEIEVGKGIGSNCNSISRRTKFYQTNMMLN